MRTFDSNSVPKPPLTFKFSHLEGKSVDLEIGAGQGLHSIRHCAQHPERTLLAVEKTSTRFTQLERRWRDHGSPSNLIPIHADAAAFVTHFLPNNSLDHVFLLYPNPYPKKKQSNLRWHNRPFLSLLLHKMKTGAGLTLATNLEWYALEAKVQFQRHWGLELLALSPVEHVPRTHFEKKYLARGEKCWNLEFRKPSCLISTAKVE
jgi:tRNA G46 methylase TrmB